MFHDQSQCFQNLSARQLITSKVRFTVHETSTEITVIQLIERTLIAWKGELFQRRDLNIQTIAGIALLTPAVCQRHNNEPQREETWSVISHRLTNGMRFLVMENSEL